MQHVEIFDLLDDPLVKLEVLRTKELIDILETLLSTHGDDLVEQCLLAIFICSALSLFKFVDFCQDVQMGNAELGHRGQSRKAG